MLYNSRDRVLGGSHTRRGDLTWIECLIGFP